MLLARGRGRLVCRVDATAYDETIQGHGRRCAPASKPTVWCKTASLCPTTPVKTHHRHSTDSGSGFCVSAWAAVCTCIPSCPSVPPRLKTKQHHPVSQLTSCVLRYIRSSDRIPGTWPHPITRDYSNNKAHDGQSLRVDRGRGSCAAICASLPRDGAYTSTMLRVSRNQSFCALGMPLLSPCEAVTNNLL